MSEEIFCEKCAQWVDPTDRCIFTTACGLGDPLYLKNIPDYYRRQAGAPKDPFHVAAEAFLEQLNEEPMGTQKSAFETQVGGDHYASKAIQPIQYIFENDLGFCEGNVIKYVTRYKSKNGIQDLKKARHYLDMLIERLEAQG